MFDPELVRQAYIVRVGSDGVSFVHEDDNGMARFKSQTSSISYDVVRQGINVKHDAIPGRIKFLSSSQPVAVPYNKHTWAVSSAVCPWDFQRLHMHVRRVMMSSHARSARLTAYRS